MTAEIAVLNKYAVALAADSAVTIQHGKGFKIFNTHKLFNLSQSSPVGVMIYENAELMSIPWETIIKGYRKQLGNKTCGKLEDYGTDFIAYLINNTVLFPEAVQDERALYMTVGGHITDLSERIDKRIRAITNSGRKVTDATIRRVTRIAVNSWHDTLKAQQEMQDLPPKFEQDVLYKYQDKFDKLIATVFVNLPLTEELKRKLRLVCTWLLTKDVSDLELEQSYSGVVIAGFGESDMHPAVITYRIESVVLNQLRYKQLEEKSDRITTNRTATVVPFAQQEMVSSFMEGIDPYFHARISDELSKIFEQYPDEIVKGLTGVSKARKNELAKDMKKIGADLVNAFDQVIKEYKQRRHVNPIVRAVSVLPKEELASMAEALVSLTSTKRRVTLDAETVGGPIDVAVISKGDGFIWIKRKHYFEADKNPQFFIKYR